jgi:uncharacterized protein (DUF433 family)
MNVEHIEINPRVCGGKPVIRGTRIPVTLILEQLAAGLMWDEVLRSYPELTRAHIHAALLYASESIDQTGFGPVAA